VDRRRQVVDFVDLFVVHCFGLKIWQEKFLSSPDPSKQLHLNR